MNWERLHPKGRKLFWQLVMLVVVLRNSAFAYGADESMPRIRIGTASDNFKNTIQLAAAFGFSPTLLRSSPLDGPDLEQIFISLLP